MCWEARFGSTVQNARSSRRGQLLVIGGMFYGVVIPKELGAVVYSDHNRRYTLYQTWSEVDHVSMH